MRWFFTLSWPKESCQCNKYDISTYILMYFSCTSTVIWTLKNNPSFGAKFGLSYRLKWRLKTLAGLDADQVGICSENRQCHLPFANLDRTGQTFSCDSRVDGVDKSGGWEYFELNGNYLGRIWARWDRQPWLYLFLMRKCFFSPPSQELQD